MGGIIVPNTKISGAMATPGIPLADSPTGGIYETPSGGLGIALSGQSFFELNQLNFLLGLKPSINTSFALAEATSSPYTYGAISPNGVAVSPDNMHVYFATSVKTIYGYSRNVSNNVLTILPGFPLAADDAISIIITPDGKQVVLGTILGARVYDRNSLTGALTFNALHADGNYGGSRDQLTISADGLFIYAGDSSSVAQYSRNALTGVWTFLGLIGNATHGVGGVALAPNGDFLAAIDNNGWLYIYPRNTATGILSAATSIIATPAGLNGGVVISPDSAFVYFGVNSYPSHTALVYSVNQTTFVASLVQTYVVGGGAVSNNPQSTGMSIDGSRLYFGMAGGDGVYVASRNATTGRLVALATFAMANNYGNAVVESPDGNMLVVSSGNPSAVNQIDVLNTSANLRHNLMEVIFDRTGVSGSVGINGTLNVFGSPVLSETVTDVRYAALAGLITQAFSAKSLFLDNAAGGLIGTITNDNAIVGSVGEYIESTVLAGAAVALATGVNSNVTSINLTSGDWDIDGLVAYHGDGTTNINDTQEGISDVSAVFGAVGTYHIDYLTIVVAAAIDATYDTPKVRISIPAKTILTVYLVTMVHFSVSTCAAYGHLRARRVR